MDYKMEILDEGWLVTDAHHVRYFRKTPGEALALIGSWCDPENETYKARIKAQRDANRKYMEAMDE